MSRVLVMGAGAWGTALAKVLAEAGHAVTLWGRHRARLEAIRSARANERMLPGIKLPTALAYTSDLPAALVEAELVVVSVPSEGLREATRPLADFTGPVVSTTKGIEFETGLTMSALLRANAPRAPVAALSGPTIALEVARGIPTAIVSASEDAATARVVQELFNTATLRVYSSTDLVGVELGGALKNVFAIAAGVGDGLGFGDNAKAALITRSIAEMRRLGMAAGAQAETFSGLSGLGDLTVTCFSPHSRNRRFGEQLGRGRSPAEALAAVVSVVEGYPTTRAALRLARRLVVTTPIIDEVHAMLYEGKNAREAVQDLMNRELKAED